MIDKINNLIGKAYHPVNFNCYHLVQELVPCIPDIEDYPDSNEGSVKNSLKHFNQVYDFVKRVSIPVDGDIVLLGKDRFTHIGVMYNNLVIHASYPCVRADTLQELKRYYPVQRFYRCK